MFAARLVRTSTTRNRSKGGFGTVA
jgi:hypothetical protein